MPFERKPFVCAAYNVVCDYATGYGLCTNDEERHLCKAKHAWKDRRAATTKLELTMDQVLEFCSKHGLVVVSNELYEKLKTAEAEE